MSYLSFIIAAFQLFGMDTSAMTTSEGLDIYLDLVVSVERAFLSVSLIVFAVFAAILILLFVTRIVMLDEHSLCCGYIALCFAVIWPVLEFVTWSISKGLADSVSSTGIIDPIKFYLLAGLMVILGWG